VKENHIDELYLKEFGIEKVQEINEAFEKANHIKDETALTIISFLLDQTSLIIKEFDKIQNKTNVFNFFYYLFLGFSFYYSQTFKPIYILVLVSPQIIPILFMIYNRIKKIYLPPSSRPGDFK
jgi:hypothetical protein